MLFVNMIAMFEIANTDRINRNTLFLSYFEKRTGTKSPQTAIVKVNELTYNPETAIDVLKYCDICEMIPIMLKGVFIARDESIKI